MLDWRDIYTRCKDLDICQSQYQFSREVMGRKPSTFSAAMAEDRTFSMETLTRSFVRIQDIITNSEEEVETTEGDDREALIGGIEDLDGILDEIWQEIRQRVYDDE
ncbi:conserved protein of unknown function [Magnetospira sp. QH-2]|nr:conserved protein of unknown function [Magnetospira sp. QH-2]